MKNPLWEKDGLKIFGNNHNVPIIYGYELSDKEKKEFDLDRKSTRLNSSH